MYTLLELQTAISQYEKARPFYESEPALIINLKKIAARSPLNDADQLLIIKELLLFSDKEEKSISKNCAEVIRDLKNIAGRDNLTCFKILLDKNLFTLENLNAIKTKPHLVDNLLYLEEQGSSLINQNCLDLLICSAFGEEPEEYSKKRTEHLCCLLLQLWNYQLLDEAKYKFLLDQVKLNRKANASYAWKDYPAVYLTSENNPPLTKGKLYMKVEDKGYRSNYNLKFYWIDSESNLITFEDSNLVSKSKGEIETIPQRLPRIVNQAYLHQIESDGRDWSASVSQQLLQKACKQEIDFSKYKYSQFEKVIKVFSTIKFKGRESYLVFYLKVLQLLEAKGLLIPENIQLLFDSKNLIGENFVTFLTQFANNNLLNEQNFKNLCSFDELVIFDRNGLVEKLGEKRLLSQPLIDMIWKSEPQKHFDTPSDMEHIKTLVDLVPLSPERLLNLIQQGKVYDVRLTFRLLKEAGIDAPDLSSAIIDKILKSPEFPTCFTEVIFRLVSCKFLNPGSLMMLITLDPDLYQKMYACTESLHELKGLLTQENLETLVINYQNIHDPLAVKMSEGYQHLHKNGLYTKENKKLLMDYHHGHPSSLACSLVLLAKNGLWSKNSGRITFQYDPTYEGAFKCLQKNLLLNQKNLDKLFLGQPQQWTLRTVSLHELHRRGWYPSSQKSLSSLIFIVDSNISSQSKYSLQRLAECNLLTEDNLQKLEESHHLSSIALNINLLTDANIIINQAQFNELVRYANILNPGLLARIPRRLLTHALLNDLFIRCIAFETDPNFQGMLEDYINRIINPNQVIQQRVAQAQPALVLNGAQSTHTADVHKTVSKSAIILKKMYSLSYDEKEIFEKIVKYIKSLPKGNKNDAAKRLLDEMKNHPLFWSFRDPVSEVTNHQMLVLFWVAIHDEKKRQGTLDNAKERFVNSLYEVQRGYNLDEDGNDDGEADDTICCAGTFNKIVEGLNSIHPDVKIKYISKEEAAKLKLRDSVFVTKMVVEDLVEKLPENELKQLKEEINKDDFNSPILKKCWKRVEQTIIEQKSEYESVFKNKQEYIKACEAGFWAIDIEKIIQAIDERLAPKKQEAPKLQAPAENGFFKSDKKSSPEMELPLWIKLLFCLPIIGQLGCLIYLFLDWCFPGKAEENSCGCLI